jgi:sigma-E factor negative regulatory protein RseC
MMKSAPVSVLAKNPLGAAPGDRVVVASDSRSILGAAALVYLLPLLLFFVGYFVVSGNGAEEGMALFAGGCCFLLAGIVIAIAERRMREKNRNLFTIVEICRD